MVLPENSPSKVAASEKPLSRFISPPALTRAASGSPRAPFTRKLAPGSGSNSAVGIVIVRPCSAAAERQPRPPPTGTFDRAQDSEDAFRLPMIGSGGDMKVFWSNGLVGSITTLAIVLLFWPLIDKAFGSVGRLWRPAKASG